MKQMEIKKGTLLQRPGELNSKIYKVKSGLLRSYSIDEKGKEHIFLFVSEGNTMVDHISPYQPSTLFIESLEDTVVLVHDKDLAQPRKNIREMIARIEGFQKRIIMLMSWPVIDRYNYFLEIYPDLINRIPQRMIASYLGVTPEALSKVKNLQLKAK